MGDRCTVVMEFRTQHLPTIVNHFGEPDELNDYMNPGTYHAMWYEVNYGFNGYKHYPNIDPELILPGIPYVGHHYAGEQYPGFIFASDGTTHLDHVAIDGQPVQDYIPDPKGDGSTFVPCSPDLLPRFLQHYAHCHALVFKETQS